MARTPRTFEKSVAYPKQPRIQWGEVLRCLLSALAIASVGFLIVLVWTQASGCTSYSYARKSGTDAKGNQFTDTRASSFAVREDAAAQAGGLISGLGSLVGNNPIGTVLTGIGGILVGGTGIGVAARRARTREDQIWDEAENRGLRSASTPPAPPPAST